MVVTSGLHADATGTNLHVFGYVQDSDPGAVGAGRGWVDTSGGTGAWLFKVRNDDDDGWETLTVTGSAIDHGTLSGLGDNDHPQYILKTLADAAGDLLVASGADAFAKLAKGTDGQVLTVDPGTHLLVWATPVTDHGALSGLGDNDHPQYVLKTIIDASGDLIVGSGADAYTRLAKGSDDDVLTVVGGVLTWAPPAVGSIPGLSELADYDADGNEITNAADPTADQSLVTRAFLTAQITGIVPGTPQGTFLVSGGQVTWVGPSDYTYHLAAGTGYINGVLYSWAAQNITLDAADATDDRIDVIGVDDTSTIFKLTGTPSANPSEPTVEPDSQLALAIVTVDAASSTPTTTVETVYTEGAGASAEWNGSTSGATWSLVSVTNPRTGTKCIRGTTLTAGSTVTLQRGSGSIDPNAFTQLVEYIRFTSAWANNRYLLIWLALNGVKKGNALKILAGTFGLDGANIADYQAIIIPTLQFAIPAGTLINQVVMQDVGGAISFGLDDIQFIAASGQTQTGGGLDQAQADARYQQLSGKGVANGYASLDGSALVPDAQIPSTITRDSEAVLKTLADAAGDLIVGTGADTFGRLAKGSDGQVLTVDPTTHLLVWASPSGGLAFDDGATPSNLASSAATGDDAFPARRDHVHLDPVVAHAAAADPHTGYVLESLIDAAGDLIVGTAADTVGRLAKGSDSQVLTVDPVTHLLAWATPAGALSFDDGATPSNLAAAAATGDDISPSRRDHVHLDPVVAHLAATDPHPSTWKRSVRVASTAAVTLATGVENGDTIDSVTLATGDRVLLKNQASGAENGIYVVAASGAPSRAADADSTAEVLQMVVFVQEGTSNADTAWLCTTNAPITLGSTALAFVQFPSPTSGGAHTIEDETTPLAPRTKLSFQGAGVSASDDSGSDRTVVTISGGATSAHTLIERRTLGSASASETFSSLGSYQNLIVKVIGKINAAVTSEEVFLRFNADTGANYSSHIMSSSGGTASGSDALNATAIRLGYLIGSSIADVPGFAAAEIRNYRSTAYHKPVTSLLGTMNANSANNVFTMMVTGWWRSTSAITSLTVLAATNNMAVGTIIEVWGES